MHSCYGSTALWVNCRQSIRTLTSLWQISDAPSHALFSRCRAMAQIALHTDNLVYGLAANWVGEDIGYQPM